MARQMSAPAFADMIVDQFEEMSRPNLHGSGSRCACDAGCRQP